MSRPAPRFKDALDVLARHGVDFVVVGGVAAVLAGAPISTFDLDIVPARSPENLDRLVAALSELDARYRDLTGRILRPNVEGLARPGHHFLLTTCGPVDVLGTIGQGETGTNSCSGMWSSARSATTASGPWDSHL